jgi:alkanesulfonate monooxygenase SsuD/methylene tetrahydromethanopterin reductase-like flavin-dependent oxidoreductase (luciferase family)
VLGLGFRNPALLAKMADTVEEISNGRLILGVGAGYHELEYRAFGYPYDHRYSRFAEAIQIVHGLLRDGRIDFRGKYHEAWECELKPPRAAQGGTAHPVRQQRPEDAQARRALWRLVERLVG